MSFTPHEPESGYVSGSSSQSNLAEVSFTPYQLAFLNKQLAKLEPQDILKWAVVTLPHLFQTTAFGLTGLVTLDMLQSLKVFPGDKQPPHVDLIFLDTLHHFSETLDLVDRVQERYPAVKLHVYRPQNAETAEEFAAQYGDRLWESNDSQYDWLAKVEPAERAYQDLNVTAVLTGRRRSQGAARGDLPVIEVDEAGLIKINPLANWSFQQVQSYIREHNVPYNALLDRGYKSVGDWHSTQPVTEGEDERSGRWKGQTKTECGIHNPRSKYAQFLREQELQQHQDALTHALSNVSVGA